MPDWLTQAVPATSSVPPLALAVRLVLALWLGAMVAAIYRTSHGREKTNGPALATTLVLLCVLTAMVSVVIGDSVARAFGLVGALSIVRFRTVVEDTRDTAFVIFAVVVGMAVGSGLLLVSLIGIPVVAVAALALDRFSQPGRVAPTSAESTLVVRFGLGCVPEQLLENIFTLHLDRHRVTAVATARQGAALDVSYAVLLKPETALTRLVAELNQIEGVQSVDLRGPRDAND